MPQPTSATPKATVKRTAGRAGRPRAEDVAGEAMRERSKDEKKMEEGSSASNALKINKPVNIVTVDMKMDMVCKVKKLQDEGLTKLVEYIGQVMSTSMSELENNHVKIRIDDFDA